MKSFLTSNIKIIPQSVSHSASHASDRDLWRTSVNPMMSNIGLHISEHEHCLIKLVVRTEIMDFHLENMLLRSPASPQNASWSWFHGRESCWKLCSRRDTATFSAFLFSSINNLWDLMLAGIIWRDSFVFWWKRETFLPRAAGGCVTTNFPSPCAQISHLIARFHAFMSHKFKCHACEA